MKIKHESTRQITKHTYVLTDDLNKRFGPVVIIFENGKFYECTSPFRSPFTREQWAVLAQIEVEISRIEKTYAN
jgi:hypothetical protein